MNAEIIEFPQRARENRVVFSTARLEAIMREVERVVSDEPEANLDRLLAMMERMGDQLVDLASLLLDEESNLQALSAFHGLCDKIVRSRAAFEQLGGQKHRRSARTLNTDTGVRRRELSATVFVRRGIRSRR